MSGSSNPFPKALVITACDNLIKEIINEREYLKVQACRGVKKYGWWGRQVTWEELCEINKWSTLGLQGHRITQESYAVTIRDYAKFTTSDVVNLSVEEFSYISSHYSTNAH